MAVINPTVQLAKVRSKIDAAQQKIALLEDLLQQAILGSVQGQQIADLIADVGIIDDETPDGDVLSAAFDDGLNSNGFVNGEELDQTAIRHALSVQRALLGELRVEEQGWNQEVNEEKARRKDLNEMAKG